MIYAVGTQAELLHFIDRAKKRRPEAVYAAPAKNTIGHYVTPVEAADSILMGSLFIVETTQLAAIS